MVRELDKEDLALLVQFVTGTSKVPLDGFKALQVCPIRPQFCPRWTCTAVGCLRVSCSERPMTMGAAWHMSASVCIQWWLKSNASSAGNVIIGATFILLPVWQLCRCRSGGVQGCSEAPTTLLTYGCDAMQGIGGPQRFQIHKAYGAQTRLPAAHTCFNQLDLIEYESKEALKDRLMLALHEGAEGFGFG